jgi:hypothetical protein
MKLLHSTPIFLRKGFWSNLKTLELLFETVVTSELSFTDKNKTATVLKKGTWLAMIKDISLIIRYLVNTVTPFPKVTLL